jgi:hypothetical protein
VPTAPIKNRRHIVCSPSELNKNIMLLASYLSLHVFFFCFVVQAKAPLVLEALVCHAKSVASSRHVYVPGIISAMIVAKIDRKATPS